MEEFLTVGHSFNAGDSLSVLPGLQEIFNKTEKKTKFYQRLDFPAYNLDDANNPIKAEGHGKEVCMNKQTFLMMKPLMETQDYIAEYNEWKGEEVDINIDNTRQDARIPLPGGPLYEWSRLIFPQLSCDLSNRWIKAKGGYTDKTTIMDWYNRKGGNFIVLNFTERYRSPYITYHFLKPYEDQLLFAGLEHEHKLFCEKWDLQIPRLFINNFLELAKAIIEAKFGMYNQSFMFHLADAMKKPRILEVCPQYPNSFPTGANGYAFVTQNAAEYFFDKLINDK